MLYLLFRITVFLVAATSLGFGVGWYVRQVRSAKRESEIQKQLNTARSRVPQLQASLKSREDDSERLRLELTEGEERFVQAGVLIQKRDLELIERERKITQLTNSLDILKAAPASLEYPGQMPIVSPASSDVELELREKISLLSQLERRLDIQDQLSREAETRAEGKTLALASLESKHEQQIEMLEEMLAEEQIQVAKYVTDQNEAEKNIQSLSDEVSELRSAESQHESEVTNLEEEAEHNRQEKLLVEQKLEKGKQEKLALEQALESEQELGRQTKLTVEQEREKGRLDVLALQQELDLNKQVQFFLEQDLGGEREPDPELAILEDALCTLRSSSDSQAEMLRQELAHNSDALSALKKRNAGLEEQLSRSRQAQLKLASGYNEGMEARKQLKALRNLSAESVDDQAEVQVLTEKVASQNAHQNAMSAQVKTLESDRMAQQKSLKILGEQLEDARGTEVRLVQRHRDLEQTIEDLESSILPNTGVEPAVLYEQLPSRIDNLKEIKGLGVAAEKDLNSLGIYHLRQIAEFDAANVDWVEIQLKKLKGRFRRNDWVAQATHLLKSVPRNQHSDTAMH